MVLTLPTSISNLAVQKTHRFATLWKLSPEIGGDLFFTDHDLPIIFELQTYTPTGAFDASARQLTAGLKEQNLDTRGIISSDTITHEDLRAKKWDQATITESLVDWRFPFAGAFRTRIYTIGSTKFSSEVWIAELNGLTNKLHAKAGRVEARPCDAELGDGRCKINLDTFITPVATSTNTAVRFTTVRVEAASQDATEPRRIFDAVTSDLVSTEDDFFNYGDIVWTQGTNGDAGVVSEVKDFVDSTRTITLYEPTPFTVADNDEFTLTAGCDKLKVTCIEKFANILNHRGSPYMPSSDKILRSPGS